MNDNSRHLNIVSNDEDEIEPLLRSAFSAEEGSFESLFQLVYHDLKNIAKHRLASERSGHTLQATALVHEAFLRLAEGEAPELKDRNHLLALSSRVMRHVLVDYARKRKSKHDFINENEQVETATVLDPNHHIDILDLDRALNRMEKNLSRLVRVVECKFFACMTTAEIADIFNVSERTIERDWSRARAHLLLAMQEEQRENHD